MKHSVVHIIDDASWGGVNRLLSCIEAHQGAEIWDQHKIMRVERGLNRAPKIEADVIVSHMAICWKNLPFFSSLRSTHPETPLIHVEHSYSERYVALNVTKRDRFADLLHLSYALFDRAVAVSPNQAAWLSRRKFCEDGHLVTIPSCVELDQFNHVAERHHSGPITIGAIGRLHPQKGFDILIEAFAEHAPADMNLVVIGDGPEREALERKAAGRKNIIFAGKTADIAAAYAQCDVIAVPSRWEPFGLVALEAMASRRPVICSRVDGLNYHIDQGATAVQQNTVDGWAEIINSISTRVAVEKLPLGRAHIEAETKFMQSWNGLISDLLTAEKDLQQAA